MSAAGVPVRAKRMRRPEPGRGSGAAGAEREVRPATSIRRAYVEGGRAIDFFLHVIRGAFSRSTIDYFGEVLRQANILLEGSVLIVLGLTFALGLAVGVEASYGARLVGAPSAAGAFTAIGDLREITPYAFGYMMAAKVSTGFVAEIGTMRITEEIDALEVMGIRSRAYLCSTRLVATWLILPAAYAIAILISFVASFLVVVFEIGQASAGGYLQLFWKFQSPTDYLFSGIKGLLMATFVVLVGCYYGFSVRGGPVEVGRATAKAMVVDLVGIHAIGIVTTQLFWGGSPRLPIGG